MKHFLYFIAGLLAITLMTMLSSCSRSYSDPTHVVVRLLKHNNTIVIANISYGDLKQFTVSDTITGSKDNTTDWHYCNDLPRDSVYENGSAYAIAVIDRIDKDN